MNSTALQGSALLAKTDAFFAPRLVTMQSIPDHRAEKTKDVAHRTRDHDERNGSDQIKWFDEINRPDHVRPENEIDDRLRPAD
jgi:hypothetical protein